MGYLSGQGAVVTFPTVNWAGATGDITRVQSTQTLDETQVKVLGQVNANTVTGAYHSVITLDIAVADDLLANDLVVGLTGSLVWTYATGDAITVSVAVTNVALDGAVDGAITGTITMAGDGALAHTVT